MAPPLLAAMAGNTNPPLAVAPPTAQLYHCDICGRGFRSRFGLSGHYKAHSKLSPDDKMKKLPGRSRVRKRTLDEKFEALDNKYKEEGWARARAQALASGSGIANEAVQLQGSVSSGPQIPILEVSILRVPLAAAIAGPMAQFQGPVVKNRVWGGSSAGSSNMGRIQTGPKDKVEEVGGGGSSSDPLSPNYWKVTGPVVRVQGPGGLLIYKASLGAANGSGKDVVIID